MQTIQGLLSSLTVGPAAVHRNLSMFPLLGGDTAPPRYLMLDDALAAGVAKVTEVSEAGSVPELAFENSAKEPVLLVDGEELVGARQNRILNITILVGPGQRLVIPVSCVERGRWSYRSRHFEAGRRMLFASARRANAAAVNESMRREGRARSDQGRIWSEIDERFAAAASHSDTAAMSELYDAERGRLEAYERALAWQPGQVGAVFAIDAQPVAVELFDSAEAFRKFMAKAVGSFAMDAVASRAPREGEPSVERVREFLERVQSAPASRFAAAGEGENVRFEGEGVAGGALEAEGRVVHLNAFGI